MRINWHSDSTPSTIDGVLAYDTDTGIVTLDVLPDDSSYRYQALMSRPQITLKFSLPYYVEIPVGAWCVYQRQRYYLHSPADIKKQGTRNIEYTLTMGTAQDNLMLYKMRNSVDGRLKWSMCAKPHEFVEEIVRNLNLRDCGTSTTNGMWIADRELCIVANERTIEFNHTYISDALQQVANTFETEWEVIEDAEHGTYTIALHKVEYSKDNPLDLSYGRGNGFVPGVGRTTLTDGLPVKRLYVEGTERNIDRSKNYAKMYGADERDTDTTIPTLRLPSAQMILYDGSHYAYLDSHGGIIDAEDGFVASAARCYQTDREGMFIERYHRDGDAPSQATKEDSLDCTEIYPSYYGRVSHVDEKVNDNPNFYDFVDSDNSINFKNHIIKGETLTVIFQSGMLAGKEFEAKYTHNERRFALVPQEIDGVMMPNESYKPVEGNEYAVFGIMLPDEYICNNETHSGASWNMLREAVRHLYENEEQKFTFKGELQGLWAKHNWLRVGNYMHIGAYINFNDQQFAPDGHLIRIVGIKDYINDPYSPTIEIANSVSSGQSVSSSIKSISNTEVQIADTKRELIQYTKRRYRDAVETIDALSDAIGDDYDERISPIAIQTMSALVGDESLQFRFVRVANDGDGDNYIGEDLRWGYTPSTGLHIEHCYLQHLTLGQALSASHNYARGDYEIWEMSELLGTYLDPEQYGRLFLYAVCPKAPVGEGYRQGEFQLFADRQEFDGGTHYNMLVGILSSEYRGDRSFVTVYGFSEILPGRITTDKIVSADGRNVINLSDGTVRLGDSLLYNVDGDNTLHLRFLTAENSNLGGWIFRDNLLISQHGRVGSNDANYTDVAPGGRFAGQQFVPNITLDAVNGKIIQGSNLVIDDDGISLLNRSGEVAAHITNNSIGNIGDIANASKSDRYHLTKTQSQYLPYGGGAYRQNMLVGSIDVGFLSNNSTLTYTTSQVEFSVPAPKDSGASNQISCYFAILTIELYRGNTKVSTLATVSDTTTHNAGDTVTLNNTVARTITIGAGNCVEGNYSIRMALTYDLSGDHSAVLSDITVDGVLEYSYAKHGFQRTVLGNDGFYTSWAQNQYIFANEHGITLRHGDVALRLSDEGLQKSPNGYDGWINL